VTTLASAPGRRRLSASNMMGLVAAFAVAYIVPPLFGSEYLFSAILAPFLALGLAALGLNLLTGYAGQVSLGSAAFMAIGAFAAYNFELRVSLLPQIACFILAGLTAALIGGVFGLPSLRLRGFYLAVSTLAAQFFVAWALTNFKWITNNSASGVVDAPPFSAFGHPVTSQVGRYIAMLSLVAVITFLVARLVRTQTGLNFIAIRDHETAAKVIGVPILKTKLLVFMISSFIIGIAGVIWAYGYVVTIEAGYGGFDLDRSFEILFIIIIGGLASIRGAYLGAAFMVILPLMLSRLASTFFPGVDSGILQNWQRVIIGSLIIIILIVEPDGLSALLDRLIKRITGRGRKESEPERRAA
jgi:branched-chain amino acid transport system permease protein